MILFILMHVLCLTPASASDPKNPICQPRCGNVSISYPFGLHHPSYYKDDWFKITCNDSFSPPKPFLGKMIDVEVLEIQSIGQVTVTGKIAWDCYNGHDNGPHQSPGSIDLTKSPYTFSNSRNQFTAIGCDTLSYIWEPKVGMFTSGCVSGSDFNVTRIDESCSGIGCCQSAISKGLKKFDVQVRSYHNRTRFWNHSKCSYSFLVNQDWFKFNVLYLPDFDFINMNERVPVVLDWAIGDNTCEQVEKLDMMICSRNGYGYDAQNGLGTGAIALKGTLGTLILGMVAKVYSHIKTSICLK